jgi:hypothetical protein
MLANGLTLDWSVYLDEKHWPLSKERVFLAAAIQRIGHLRLIEWSGEEPRWANHQRRPFLPSAEEAFKEGCPVTKLHEAFAPIVRAQISPAAFARDEANRRIAEAILVGEPEDLTLEAQSYSADLRANLEQDLEDPVTYAHWNRVWWEFEDINGKVEGAERLLPIAASQLVLLAQTGRLKTFARPKGGGATLTLDPAIWEIDSGLPRIASCSINPDAPLDSEAPGTHWIFVDQADLDREMHDLDEEQAKLRQKAAQPLNSLVEGTVNDCATWLMVQFEDPACPLIKKEQFFESAKKKFGAALSERGFNDAWRTATIDYPERRKPGPRETSAHSQR